jgi:hypothetical protein
MTPVESGIIGTLKVWIDKAEGGTHLFVEGELNASAPEGKCGW